MEIIGIIGIQMGCMCASILLAKYFNKKEAKERNDMIEQGRKITSEIYKEDYMKRLKELEIGTHYRFGVREANVIGVLIERQREGYTSKVLLTGDFTWTVNGFISIEKEVEMNIHGTRLPIAGGNNWEEQVKIIKMLVKIEPNEDETDDVRFNKFNNFFERR